MADYYPLLARAVAALPNSTPEKRGAIYERAKKALLGQLNAMQPPPPHGAIEREAQALDEAVARLEREFAIAAAAEAVAAPLKPAPAPDPSPAEETPDPRRRPARRGAARQGAARRAPSGARRKAAACAASPSSSAFSPASARCLAMSRGSCATVPKISQNSPRRPTAPVRTPVARSANASAAKPSRNRVRRAQLRSCRSPIAPLSSLATHPSPAASRPPSEPWSGSGNRTNRGPNQQLVSAIHADVDIPDAKLKATILIEKNFDPSLSFSHTINVRFFPGEGSSIGNINAIGMPEMRADDAPKGVALQGLPVQIAANAFLVGLNQASAEQNKSLLTTPNWMDIQLSLANGSVAKITMEKGPGGRKIFNEVFAEWNGK